MIAVDKKGNEYQVNFVHSPWLTVKYRWRIFKTVGRYGIMFQPAAIFGRRWWRTEEAATKHLLDFAKDSGWEIKEDRK